MDLPPAAAAFLEQALPRLEADPRLLGVTIGGSGAMGVMDEHSDVDLVIACADSEHAAVLRDAPALAAELGPLLVGFTGEHVGEPRLLICLYGPPLLHVDLKFVARADLHERVEDGPVLWQRDGAFDDVRAAGAAVWPQPDPQWLEDRIWVWIHYTATKIARGELFECLDALALIRRHLAEAAVAQRGGRPQAVRRLEQHAPELVPRFAATIGDHTRNGCVDALRASIDLYDKVREDAPPPVRRIDAEAAAVAHLDAVARG